MGVLSRLLGERRLLVIDDFLSVIFWEVVLVERGVLLFEYLILMKLIFMCFCVLILIIKGEFL